MTEKSQDESAETLSVAETSGAECANSPASSKDSSAEDTSTGPKGSPQTQVPATTVPGTTTPGTTESPESGASDSAADAEPEHTPSGDSPSHDSSITPDGSPADAAATSADARAASAAEPTPDSEPDSEPGSAAHSGHKDAAEPQDKKPSAAPAAAGSAVRWSQPTPKLQTSKEAGTADSDISSFFDDLDEKFMAGARRLGSYFRRTAPDATSDSSDSSDADSWDQPSTAPSHAPPAPPAGDRDSSSHPEPAHSNGVSYSDSELDGTSSTSEAAPLHLPRPRRALDEQRQRDVILRKAAAIEAATDWNHRPAGREVFESADDEEDLFTYIPPYNLPSRDPDPAPSRTDLYRQIFVTIGALASLVSLLWMFGIFTDAPAILGGNGLDELADGWYSGGQALLSPDANFYWFWPIIVLGLLAHAVHQWTTTQISTPRQRRSGWQVGSASLLMLIWTAAVHHDLLTLAALAALATALALIDAIRQFTFRTARTSSERRFTDTPTGLFTGWAMVAAMSSLSVWLTAMGWRVPGIPAVLWALLGLGVCIWAAAYYAMTERGRIALAIGMGWGMFWLIFPRLLSDVTSVWVAISAAMGAFVVILATESRRHKINHAERRAAMGRPLEDII